MEAGEEDENRGSEINQEKEKTECIIALVCEQVISRQ